MDIDADIDADADADDDADADADRGKHLRMAERLAHGKTTAAPDFSGAAVVIYRFSRGEAPQP